MKITPIDIAVIVVYLLCTLGLGLYQALKIKSSGDYYAGGRKFNKFYLIMHALGTASHADEPISVIGGAYAKGISGIWYTYMYLPLTPIFRLIAPYVRRTRFVTVADFFRARYDKNLGVLYTVMGVLKLSIAIGVGLKGTATVFSSITGSPPGGRAETMAIFAMTIVFVMYGFAGGLRATVITESIQGPLIVLMSILLLPFGLHLIGGFHGLHQSLKPGMFSFTAEGYEFTPRWIFAGIMTALIGWVAQPGIVAALGSGKSELEGRVGYTYGTTIKRFCAMGWVFTGIVLAAAVAQNQVSPALQARLHDHREQAFGIAMQAMLPTGMLGLMFAAILSSQMATLSAHMVNSSALASRNLYKNIYRPAATDREVLVVGRILSLALVAIGVLLATQLERVATALTMLLGFASIMGVVIWAGVLWRRSNSAGAWAAVAVLFFTWAAFGPLGMFLKASPMGHGLPMWVGKYGREQFLFELMISYIPVGVVTLVVVSLLTKPQPKEQLDHFFLLLKTPVGQEQKLIDAGVPIVYAGSSNANPLETKYPRLVHWGGFVLAAVICV